ncbi:MAG TPA: NAD(P)/FAD-dependent oxidoreductase, partial [Acidobacteriaceae bacterium]|nr:NAD(P)/FAD-dependent oxidoreductase [Acidobacteriaceae bacterium]
MSRVIVIGAGPMGLAAAYQAVLNGHEVDVLENAPEPGGMAGHFDFGDISLERFYHFVCHPDQPIFDLLAELGIASKMQWVPTSMGFFFNGRLHDWGNPVALLKLPGVGLVTKFRYALFAALCVQRKNWGASLENTSAREWITRWCGQAGYDIFWRPLFDLKFYEYADSISAAWMWTRMRRVGRSRSSIMQEEMGYIAGGSKTLIDALVGAIQTKHGRVHMNAGAQRVTTMDGSVTGVETNAGHFPADLVLSTIPIPLIPKLVPDLPQEWNDRYKAIKNIGLCCLIFKLKHPVSRHFWVNISHEKHDIPGIIEFSNLRPLSDSIVYVPYYVPLTNEKFSWSDEQLIDDSFTCLQQINSSLTREDILDVRVAR